MPHASVTSTPNVSLKRRCTSVGTASPPAKQARRRLRSYADAPGACSIAFSITGRAPKMVTPCCCSCSSTKGNSKRGIITTVFPAIKVDTSTDNPKMWHVGSTMPDTSLGCTSATAMPVTASCVSVRWVCVTPLGRAVVPDVYMMTAGASSLMTGHVTSAVARGPPGSVSCSSGRTDGKGDRSPVRKTSASCSSPLRPSSSSA